MSERAKSMALSYAKDILCAKIENGVIKRDDEIRNEIVEYARFFYVRMVDKKNDTTRS